MPDKNRLKLFALLLAAILPFYTGAQELYVSNAGLDRNPGTKAQPLATVGMALRKARDLRRLNDASVKDGIRIIVGGGVYYLREPLFIRPEDSGTETSPTIIEAEAGTSPVFSGGIPVKGWRRLTVKLQQLPASASGKVWVTSTPSGDFRQLWVNGRKATRARENDADSMSRILSWDHENETCRIPVPPGINFSFIEEMEMVIHQWWAIAILRVQSMKVEGNSAVLHFKQPESRIQSEHPWPAPWISKETGNSAFYLVNALQYCNSFIFPLRIPLRSMIMAFSLHIFLKSLSVNEVYSL